MACEVCAHCESPVRPGEGTLQNGFSYHARCKKCYVCSETNLHNAEIFKGVIFCSGCSRRIFKGCSTARRVKTRGTRRRGRARGRQGNFNRVIELARLSMSSDTKSEILETSNHISDVTTVLNISQTIIKDDNLKKDSIDMATTTDVTQELLKRIYTPADDNNKIFASPAKPREKCKNHRVNENKKNIYSDLRIAELGASTEIAHVALRRRSEVPVIIHSESGLRKKSSRRMSYICQESDSSGDQCIDSDYSKDMVKMHWMDRRFRSIVKLPYVSFKKNILTRSSLVDTLCSDDEKQCIVKRFKNLFHRDIMEHQRRGLERLFSTINRKKTPYKLGWLQIMSKIPENTRLNETQSRHADKRCKHFRRSHSYRCMRSQVMKSAGPTKSELAVIRTKLKNCVFCDFLQKIFNFDKQFIHIMTSQAYK